MDRKSVISGFQVRGKGATDTPEGFIVMNIRKYNIFGQILSQPFQGNGVRNISISELLGKRIRIESLARMTEPAAGRS